MAWVIPDVFVATIKGSLAGNAVEQVHAFRLVTVELPALLTREEALEAAGEKIKDGWKDNMLTHFASAYSFTGVDIVDLNSLDGWVGTIPASATGANPGEPYPSNIAAVARKSSARVRGTRQGRMFLGGLLEASGSGNRLLPSVVSEIQTSLNALRADWEETGVIADWQLQPVVIHTRAGEPVGVSVVTGYTLDAGLSHQDRRIRVR